jgi:hypothetical protein
MPTPTNQKLYDQVKRYADSIYEKPSAYKSGFIVKKYKELGGKYADDHKEKNLGRWFKERWVDVGHKNYPVYRPTILANYKTPLTVYEIDPGNLQRQIKLKQKINRSIRLI